MPRLPALAVLLLLALAAPAFAQGVIDRAAEALRSDPVYVDPGAEAKVSSADAERIRQAIRDRDAGPLYVAVLPAAAADEVGGSADQVAAALRQALRRHGTYAVVVGNRFRAGSDDLPRGVTAEQRTAAVQAHGGEGVTPTLLDFVQRMGSVRAGNEPAGTGSGGGDGGGGGGIGAAAILLPLLA